MRTAKTYGKDGVAIYTGDVVAFDRNGRGTVTILVEEIARGCVRGRECDEKGVVVKPEKKWRKKTNEVQLAR